MTILNVDDLLIVGSPLQAIQLLASKLEDRFEIEDCGESVVCLSLEISWNCKTLVLEHSHTDYSRKVLKQFERTGFKPVSTPMDQKIDSTNLPDNPMCKTVYGQTFGNLMFLKICTRPELCFLGQLSQYME